MSQDLDNSELRGSLGLVQKKPGLFGGSSAQPLSLSNFANTAGEALAQRGGDDFAANFLKAVGAFANVAEGLPRPKPCEDGEKRAACRNKAKAATSSESEDTTRAGRTKKETSLRDKKRRDVESDTDEELSKKKEVDGPRTKKSSTPNVLPAPAGASLSDIVGGTRLARSWQYFDASRSENPDVTMDIESERSLAADSATKKTAASSTSFLEGLELFASVEDVPTVAPSKNVARQANESSHRQSLATAKRSQREVDDNFEPRSTHAQQRRAAKNEAPKKKKRAAVAVESDVAGDTEE